MARDPRVALLSELLARPEETMAVLGSGADHTAFAVGDDLVARFARSDGAAVGRESRLLAVLADRVPVPRVVESRPDLGLLVTTRVAGEPLLGRPVPPDGTIDAIADILAAVHALPADDAGVDHDPFPLTAFAEEALANLASSTLDTDMRRMLEAALSRCPEETSTSVVVHNDFGAEHLFADEDGGLTGVIDWADAAIADPARDLSRVLRDFGPRAYRRVVDRYPHDWDAGSDARAWFLARCAALEDLAYGLSTGHDVYATAALRSLRWLTHR